MLLSTRAISSVLFNNPFVRRLPICQFLRTNHYKVLELTPTATQDEIKNAFIKLSKKYHPDLNNNSEESTKKFQEITAAYEILGNEKTRKEYNSGHKTLNIKIYRKSDIDERIFRTKFYDTNVDPWDTGQTGKKKKHDKFTSVKRQFKEENNELFTEKYHNVIQAGLFFCLLCLSALISQIFKYFDLRTEFVEEAERKQIKYFKNIEPGKSPGNVVYIYKYSG